jgi:endonuclease/exonuclease/phosphatase family metal-dependent hydrolase
MATTVAAPPEPSILDPLPEATAQDVAALRELLSTVPAKQLERNLLVATWNLREFGQLARTWAQPEGRSPARDLHAVRCIGEIVARFDVVAIQEVQRDIGALQALMIWLGPDWSFAMTDVTRGARAGSERLAFVYDTRRVRLSGLASELVLSPEDMRGTDPHRLHQQFARTPYSVAFFSKGHTFVLTTVHIRWGREIEREPEIRAIAEWLKRSQREIDSAGHDLLALGDWNIEELTDDNHRALTSTGLAVPPELDPPAGEPAFDQIAWFPRGMGLRYTGRGGRVQWKGTILRALDPTGVTFRISDHVPLWAEFGVSETDPV